MEGTALTTTVAGNKEKPADHRTCAVFLGLWNSEGFGGLA